MIKQILTIPLILLCITIFATPPNWSVDVTKFSSTMTITGVIQLADVEENNSNDIVAAFVGDECRGVAYLLPSAELKRAYVYLMIQSNEATSETVTFKIYDSANDAVIDVTDNQLFIGEQSIGSQLRPYIFANTLINGTDITSFSLSIQGEQVSINSQNHSIIVSVPDSISLSTLVPSLDISNGAQVRINTLEINGNDTIDFTNSVLFTVTSQDGTSTQWTVTVIQTENPLPLETGTIITSFGISTVGAQVSIDDVTTALLTVNVSNFVPSSEQLIENTRVIVTNDWLEFIGFPVDANAVIVNMKGQIIRQLSKLISPFSIQNLEQGLYVVKVINSKSYYVSQMFMKI